jgi:DNA polymerase I-like protein with 3'-5' exonuclease and polymerase domains
MEGSDGSLEDMVAFLGTATKCIGQNIIGYDLPVIQKLYGFTFKGEVIDTLLVSQLLYPDMLGYDMVCKRVTGKQIGSHSLKAWGIRLGVNKGDHGEQENAWEELTPGMLSYCKQDVKVTLYLYNHFLDKGMPNDTTMWIEHEYAKVLSRQEKYGVLLDVKATQRLHVELMTELDELDAKLLEVFTPIKTWYPKPYPKKPTKKDGTKAAVLLKQEAEGYEFNDELEWGKWEDEEFKPSSRQSITKWLVALYDWKPTVVTDKGTPQVNEDVLKDLDYPGTDLLAHRFKIIKLIGFIAEGKNAWLKLVDPDTDRLHGRVKTLGCVTRRCSHSNPNLGQTPGVTAYKGKEVRSLFTAARGKTFVGCDMAGLELRMLAHYMAKYDNGEYGDIILNGDIHTYNQEAAGLPTRNQAKTFIYGFLYGAGVGKIGEIIGKGAKEGTILKDKFLKDIPAIAELSKDLISKVDKTGAFNAIDGHVAHVRSSHSALNVLLQGAGAIVCKVWMVLTDIALQKKGYVPGVDYEFVLSVHDEFTSEVRKGIEEDVASITAQCAADAGEFFNLRIPLEGDPKIGDNWYDVH